MPFSDGDWFCCLVWIYRSHFKRITLSCTLHIQPYQPPGIVRPGHVSHQVVHFLYFRVYTGPAVPDLSILEVCGTGAQGQ